MRSSQIDAEENELLQTMHNECIRFFRRLRPIVLLFNGGFVLFFLWWQIWPLAFSYLAGAIFFEWELRNAGKSKRSRNPNVHHSWIILFAQSLMAVLMIGPDAGFQFYLVSTLVFAFSDLKYPHIYKMFQALFILAFFIICDVGLLSGITRYALSPEITAALRHFNIFGLCAVLAWNAHSHALTVREAENALRHIAGSDPLTGLLNRRAINEITEREIKRCRRRRHALSLILCDIDFFKKINDTNGHAAGDHVLQAIADLMKGTLREYDHLARWGGEEFLLVLPETDAETAARVAERLRQRVEASEIRYESQHIPVTLTLGVTALHPDENWHAALARADEGLYQGKAAGRNRVVSL